LRTGGWKVANVEFSEGEREADIEIRFHDTGAETTMQLSVPHPLNQSDKRVASGASPPKREVAPGPSASASPAPASVPHAPAPGDFEVEEDEFEDY
jgi:hypothetical protein